MEHTQNTKSNRQLDSDRLLDRPVLSGEEDLLGFGDLAALLAKAIQGQSNRTSFTLGLDGPWGSGKSSIFHLLQESIAHARNEIPDDGIGLVVVPFSPWLITNRTALVAGFFGQLGNAIDEAAERAKNNAHLKKRATRKTFGSLRKKVHKFSEIASVASTATSVVDPTLISTVTASGTKMLSRFTKGSDKTLEELKTDLQSSLGAIAQSDPSFRILVLVDDLDRLDPGDALEILRLVKTVGDLPSVTYLLAYDRKALARAISHSVKIDNGEEYLEKIIQFSFNVPPLEPFRLRNWLRSELENLFPEDFDPSSERAGVVLDIWAGRLLKTPRDLKRLLFAVRAIWPDLRGKADLLDLVWLQMIRDKASHPNADLYSWVTGYLQGLDAIAIGGHVTGEKEDRKKLYEILTTLGWRPYEEKSILMDFHYLDTLLVGVTGSYLDESNLDSDNRWTHKVNNDILQQYRSERRLSSPWHWRLYFALDVPSHAVTDDEWDALTDAADKSTQSLSEAMSLLLNIRDKTAKDAADQILSHAIHDQKAGKLEYSDRWVTAILKQGKELEKLSKTDSFGFGRLFEHNLKKIMREVSKTLRGKKRSSFLKDIFDDMDCISFTAGLLREQYHVSTKTGYEKEEKYYLTDQELKDVIDMQVRLYTNISPSELRALANPFEVLYTWRDVTQSDKGPSELFKKATLTEEELVATLSTLKIVSSSAQNNVPHVVEDYLKHFVDTGRLKSRVEAVADSKSAEAGAAKDLLSVWWSEKD